MLVEESDKEMKGNDSRRDKKDFNESISNLEEELRILLLPKRS